MHEWMADNGHTPHIVVDASVDGVSVPPEHVKDGNFGGVPFDVWVPTGSILGIYARETGQGMIFSNDSGASASVRNADEVEETRSRPHLRVVK
jgi:stringent starvation protein B